MVTSFVRARTRRQMVRAFLVNLLPFCMTCNMSTSWPSVQTQQLSIYHPLSALNKRISCCLNMAVSSIMNVTVMLSHMCLQCDDVKSHLCNCFGLIFVIYTWVVHINCKQSNNIKSTTKAWWEQENYTQILETETLRPLSLCVHSPRVSPSFIWQISGRVFRGGLCGIGVICVNGRWFTFAAEVNDNVVPRRLFFSL